MSVLFPEPLEPTSAVVVPAGARKETPRRTGAPSSYSKVTSSKAISPATSSRGARPSSPSSSVAIRLISRMRSRPAKASVICVPMAAISTSGAATSAVKKMYMKKSPSVI